MHGVQIIHSHLSSIPWPLSNHDGHKNLSNAGNRDSSRNMWVGRFDPPFQKRNPNWCLRLSIHSVILKTALSKMGRDWKIGIASVLTHRNGIPTFFGGGDHHVGILLSDSCPKKSTKACLDNRKRCDYDVLVTRGRKMSVDQFADFLTGEMAKFKKT